MKHFHMLMASITVAIFVYQFVLVFQNKNAQLATKSLKIAVHVIYFLLLITGVLQLLPLIKVVGLPHFILAKIVLLIVAVSATIKATRLSTKAPQARAGMCISAVAYIGIIALALLKPMNLF
ncbi:hypothetical protein MOMA_01970 [Moraxella macacae 0408225]|uniref:Invasion gene expression up-regulator SirB n=1 Tax=Moraxella macacae 0408225 TaxID=1230338 RepID=L2F8C2_9GAMM|nr:SirB2 family protein [Moraxella macacae]ELA09135.1 hypothetical protein MOMA_01970 [Moraxella macacae 0408225]